MPTNFTTATDTPLPLCVTMGEPAGIGTEVMLKAWHVFKDAHAPETPVFFCVDDPVRLGNAARTLGIDLKISTISHASDAYGTFGDALPVLPLTNVDFDSLHHTELGTPNTATAKAVLASIEQSVRLCLSGQAGGMVTNPIQKKTLNDAGFEHPGHTEYLGVLTADAPLPHGMQRGPVMMLTSRVLRVSPATVHVALKDVTSVLTSEDLHRTAIIMAQSLTRDFGIIRPVIAVAGLNPHAGEGGAIGTEEIDIIAPVIADLKSQGMQIIGPIPADTMFHEEAREQYDAALTMYHDQGLIPIKALDFHGAVNMTLGLPIVRTSPDHGTGLNIAGKNLARPDSFIQAVKLADHVAKTRRKYDNRATAATT